MTAVSRLTRNVAANAANVIRRRLVPRGIASIRQTSYRVEALAPPLIADRYQLLREVSRAPDATFWLAADTLLDRQVMVELLRPELAEDAVAVERFQDALRVTARGGPSAHGRLLDGGTDQDQQLPFAVFEWDEAPQGAADAVEALQPVA